MAHTAEYTRSMALLDDNEDVYTTHTFTLNTSRVSATQIEDDVGLDRSQWSNTVRLLRLFETGLSAAFGSALDVTRPLAFGSIELTTPGADYKMELRIGKPDSCECEHIFTASTNRITIGSRPAYDITLGQWREVIIWFEHFRDMIPRFGE